MALADFDGEASLYIPTGHNQGLASLKRAAVEAVEHRVECTRLDTFLESRSVRRVDVMKIDVEGAEAQVLDGGSATLERSHPAILLEVGETQIDPTRRRSLEILLDKGYVIHGMSYGNRTGFRLVPLNDLNDAADFREPYRALNVVALHPRRENGQELVSPLRRAT